MLCNFQESSQRPIVVIGCDEVGSAIACLLHRAGTPIVIVDAADPPCARRGMSYADAWYVGGATLNGIDACFCSSVKSIPPVIKRGEMIAATTWSWEGVAAAVHPLAVIETRYGRITTAAACRPLALADALAVGVRATGVGGWPADIVVGDSTDSASADAWTSRDTVGAFVRTAAPHTGRFRTRCEIAEYVDTGDVVGELGEFAVVARASGVLRGLAPRGARIARGDLLTEIDTRGEPASCFGIADPVRVLAERVAAAIRRRDQPATARAKAHAPDEVPVCA